jgi:hypothetical protein
MLLYNHIHTARSEVAGHRSLGPGAATITKYDIKLALSPNPHADTV